MIVRPAGDGAMLLITQPAHARLARRLMEACVPLMEHPRRAAILHAIAEHDGGWQEEDDAPEFDADRGNVADFVHIAVAVRHRVWPRAVGRLAADPWAAALVAHHAITVYDRYRADPEWDPFFAGMEASRETMVARSFLPREHLAADYLFLRLADLISLCFCTGSLDEQRIGPWSVQLQGSSVLVSPDPFGGQTIPIEISAVRVLPNEIRSTADLREAMARSPSVILRGTLAPRTPEGSL